MNAACPPPLPPADLAAIVAQTGSLWEALRGKRIFVTGATGFFGCWLLESFACANDQFQLGATLVALTRNAAAFARKAPHLASCNAIQFHEGDVRNFTFPDGAFSFVIHGATQASAALNDESPLIMLDTIVEGTRRVLEFARHCGASRVLLTSSGAVYGRQPSSVANVEEDYSGAPDVVDFRSAYGEGKRLAELMCAIYHRAYSMETLIARCFAFVGPHLPLDTHFAAGNFIRDGFGGGPLVIKGDGTPYRSYLYMSDLAVWLWTILFKGAPCRPYNVGSDEGLTVAETAQIVAKCFDPVRDVEIALKDNPAVPPARYVPSVQRAKSELGLRILVPVEEAFRKTITWNSIR